MKSRIVLLSALLMLSAAPVFAGQPAPSLKCDIGPVNKTYGGTQWEVHSCDDGKSVIIMSATGNPALPFYFMFTPDKDKGTYHLEGEGTGDKSASDAAYEELKLFTDKDIVALLDQTKAPKQP